MTQCERCPVQSGGRCASDRHPLFCRWAGDPILDRAILHASGRTPPVPPRPTPSPVMPPLMQMAVDCIYRDITCSTCEGVRCWAGYGNNRKGQATTLANCERCVGRLVGLGQEDRA